MFDSEQTCRARALILSPRVGEIPQRMFKEIAMRVVKMRMVTLVAAVLTTALLAGCGASSEDETAGQVFSAAAMGTEQNFAVLGGSTVTNTGSSVITGDLGLSPGTSITGFAPLGPGLVTGETHTTDAVALQAQTDTTATYIDLEGQSCDTTVSADLGGTTLTPGVYCAATSMGLTGALTLDAGGNPNAVWVFQMGSTLTTASNSSVVLINGADACNVFWQVGSSATLGTTTSFVGNVFALTSITLNNGASVSGRVLARNGAVTLNNNTITAPVCGVAPVTSIALGKTFSDGTISAGGTSTLTITLTNANGTIANLIGPLIDNLPAGLVVVPNSVSTTCMEPAPLSGWFIVDKGKVGLTAEGFIPANSSCTVTATVTAAAAGSYVNTLPAGALQTDLGNNAEPASATLTVVP
jgi:uncharacterized repeat protein (TIGR01451 family)